VKPHAISIVLLVAFSGTAVQAGGWKVVFEDRFAGTELDHRKWATRYIYEGETKDFLNDEIQRYREKDNHRVADGLLSLIARKVPTEFRPNAYESGMIRSRQTFYYGYFEAKVRLTTAKGTWPAFWLNPDYNRDGELRWPPEIDAFEYVINGTNETPDMIHSGVVIDKAGTQGGKWTYRDPAFDEQWTYYRAPGPLNQDWIVVGLLWKPDSVTQYVNGKKLYTRTYRWVYSDGSEAGPAHILLNLAVGGHWAGLNGVEASKFPQQFQVQYVRACQFTMGDDGAADCGGSLFTPNPAEESYTAPYDDLPRTTLIDAVVEPRVIVPGGSVRVQYKFQAENTGKPHSVYTTIIDERGKDVFSVATPPAVATTAWRGVQSVNQVLSLPVKLGPGRYSVLLSVGSPKTTIDPTPQNIPLAANEKFGLRDSRLRYRVGGVELK